MITIVLYGKPGCHLCEDVSKVIRELKELYAFEFKEQSILDDDKLFNAYAEDIPVLTVNGEIFSRYKISREQLAEKLETLTERSNL